VINILRDHEVGNGVKLGRPKIPVEVTELDDSVKVVSADYLRNSLSAGSKKRLDRYCFNLTRTEGKENVLFDDKVEEAIIPYLKDKNAFDSAKEYLNNLKDDGGISFSRNYKNYNSVSETFRMFSLPDYTSFRWNRNYQKALKDLKKIISSANLTPLVFKSDDDIREALPKSDTHSGWTYVLTGFKKKGDNMEGIFQTYNKAFQEAKKVGSFNRPVMVGFRTQASGEFDSDGAETGTCKHKTRVVCMYDLLCIINELHYSIPFQHFLQNKALYAGGKAPYQIAGIIRGFRERYQSWWSLDYSKYDMTLSSWILEDVFSIIKSAFLHVEEDEWALLVHDFIHKDFVVAEGVVHSDRGVPSGSMFTQIVDTLANWLMIRTYFNSINADCRMIIMGDDNLVFHRLDINEVDNLASYLNKNFGVQINADKSLKGIALDHPEFISRTWMDNGQWRHPSLLVSRLLFPERHRQYNEIVTPYHVILAFILTYRLGMEKLINVNQFRKDHPISAQEVWDKVDSKYLPGALAYIREYTNVRML
jgi:hypothetical protein